MSKVRPPLSEPPAHHRRVPLSMRERMMIAGLGLAVVVAALAAWWTFTAAGESESPIAALFEHLERGENDAAFRLLAPELQAEVGTADALGQRWKATGLTRVRAKPGCASIGSRHDIVQMDAVATGGDAAGTFRLGEATGWCKGGRKRSLLANVRDGTIVALQLAY